MRQGKNDSVIADMYKRYYSKLMLIACSYTHDKSAAEDLVQEAFLKAILSYKPGGSFLGWANKVIRNDFLNTKKREKYVEKYVEAGNIEEMSLPACEDLLKGYIKGEERVKMVAMIASLPEKYRDVMIASVYLQEENSQIAKAYGISEENVRQIKSRAKKMLMKMWGEENERYK